MRWSIDKCRIHVFTCRLSCLVYRQPRQQESRLTIGTGELGQLVMTLINQITADACCPQSNIILSVAETSQDNKWTKVSADSGDCFSHPRASAESGV